MRFGSLFSGIGGFDLGLERAGMECAWQVEIDEYCQRVLTKHWPSVPKHGDIRNVGRKSLEKVDLIAGGFPCQPFSVAGKRRGTADDRHLWPEMFRVISELKPTWVVGENVPGIINIFLDQAIADLESAGYTCESFVLPAVAFDTPHRRDRLFVIAYNESHLWSASRDERPFSSDRGNSSLSHSASSGRDDGGNSGKRGQVSTDEEWNSSKDKQEREGRESIVGQNGGDRLMADSEREREGSRIGGRHRSLGNVAGKDKQQRGSSENGSGQRWPVEPSVGRVAYGVSHRVDRLRGLGNAVVPQVAEFIGKIVLKTDRLINLGEINGSTS